jgi:L-fuconolactonase
MKLNRRKFIQTTAAAGTLTLAGIPALAAPKPEIIDCHTHIYDPTRPEGVPWPPREEGRLYRRTLPADVKKAAGKTGVTGTVVVEASEWLADNDWVLKQAEKDPFIVGFIGHVPLDHPDFEKTIRRLTRNPVFRGVRVRGARSAKIAEPDAIRALQLLAEFDLTLDFNCLPAQLPLIAQAAKQAPKLRIVINHLANVTVNGKAPPEDWGNSLREAAQNERVFLKVSGLVEGSRRDDFRAPRELDYYRPVLDAARDTFGVDRLLFASNWPVSGLFAPYETVFGLISGYFGGQGGALPANIACENSQKAYKWVKRK